jgi:hypothetical protein
MAEAKTKPTDADVSTFVATIEDPIVGFGQYHYMGASGRGGDSFVIGFSPRKQALTLYLPGLLQFGPDVLAGLGKHSLGKGCLYVMRLSDVDPTTLRHLLEAGLHWHKTANPSVA